MLSFLKSNKLLPKNFVEVPMTDYKVMEHSEYLKVKEAPPGTIIVKDGSDRLAVSGNSKPGVIKAISYRESDVAEVGSSYGNISITEGSSQAAYSLIIVEEVNGKLKRKPTNMTTVLYKAVSEDIPVEAPKVINENKPNFKEELPMADNDTNANIDALTAELEGITSGNTSNEFTPEVEEKTTEKKVSVSQQLSNKIISMNHGSKIIDSKALRTFNRQNGTLNFYVCRRPAMVYAGLLNKRALSDDGKPILLSTASQAAREAVNSGKKFPPMSECVVNHQVVLKQKAPGKNLAACITMPTGGANVPYNELLKEVDVDSTASVEFDKDATPLTRLIPMTHLAQLITTYFGGAIHENKEIFGEQADAVEVVYKAFVPKTKDNQTTAQTEAKPVYKLANIKRSLIIPGAFTCMEYVETIDFKDIKTEEDRRAADFSLFVSVVRGQNLSVEVKDKDSLARGLSSKYANFTPEAKESVGLAWDETAKEAYVTSTFLKAGAALPEISAYYDKNTTLNEVLIPVKKPRRSEKDNTVKIIAKLQTINTLSKELSDDELKLLPINQPDAEKFKNIPGGDVLTIKNLKTTIGRSGARGGAASKNQLSFEASMYILSGKATGVELNTGGKTTDKQELTDLYQDLLTGALSV